MINTPHTDQTDEVQSESPKSEPLTLKEKMNRDGATAGEVMIANGYAKAAEFKEKTAKEKAEKKAAKKPGGVRRLVKYIGMKIKNVFRKKPEPKNVLPPRPEKKNNLSMATKHEAPSKEKKAA